MHYFLDAQNSQKSHVLDQYISSYCVPQGEKSVDILNKLVADIKEDLNLNLMPIKLIDIYRPCAETNP